MSVSPTVPPRQGAMYFEASRPRRRITPTAWSMARRRLMLAAAKFILPVTALALLASIAMWPEIERLTDQARRSVSRLAAQVQTGLLFDPVYHGTDEHGQPYTVTAKQAREASADRVDLTQPKADVLLQSGRWMMVQSRQGVYRQKLDNMDLSGDVTLYRDDGLTLITDSANIDLARGGAAGSDRVHAEGPFGTLDAQGFTVLDRGTSIQFAGPGRLVMTPSR